MKKIIILFLICFPISLLTQNLSWEPVNIDVGLKITTILQDSTGRIIIQSEKGTFIITNLSEVKRIDNLFPDSIKISCLAIDTNSNLFAGTYKSGVYKFNETLNIWEQFGSKPSNPNVRNMVISKSNDIVISSNYLTLFRFDYNLLQWKILNNKSYDSLTYFYVLTFDKYNNLYAGYYNFLYKLKDKDSIWNSYLSPSKSYAFIMINYLSL